MRLPHSWRLNFANRETAAGLATTPAARIIVKIFDENRQEVAFKMRPDIKEWICARVETGIDRFPIDDEENFFAYRLDTLPTPDDDATAEAVAMIECLLATNGALWVATEY